MQAARWPPAEWPLMTSGRPSFASSRDAARICSNDVVDGNIGAKIVGRHRDIDAVGIQPAGEMAEEGAIERLPVAAVNEDDDRTGAIAGKQIDPVAFARPVSDRLSDGP